MEKKTAHLLLETLINYFEAGNMESDTAAKKIMNYDFDHQDVWHTAIKKLQESGQWTGLRAPEADILLEALQLIQEETTRKNKA